MSFPMDLNDINIHSDFFAGIDDPDMAGLSLDDPVFGGDPNASFLGEDSFMEDDPNIVNPGTIDFDFIDPEMLEEDLPDIGNQTFFGGELEAALGLGIDPMITDPGDNRTVLSAALATQPRINLDTFEFEEEEEVDEDDILDLPTAGIPGLEEDGALFGADIRPPRRREPRAPSTPPPAPPPPAPARPRPAPPAAAPSPLFFSPPPPSPPGQQDPPATATPARPRRRRRAVSPVVTAAGAEAGPSSPRRTRAIARARQRDRPPAPRADHRRSRAHRENEGIPDPAIIPDDARRVIRATRAATRRGRIAATRAGFGIAIQGVIPTPGEEFNPPSPGPPTPPQDDDPAPFLEPRPTKRRIAPTAAARAAPLLDSKGYIKPKHRPKNFACSRCGLTDSRQSYLSQHIVRSRTHSIPTDFVMWVAEGDPPDTFFWSGGGLPLGQDPRFRNFAQGERRSIRAEEQAEYEELYATRRAETESRGEEQRRLRAYNSLPQEVVDGPLVPAGGGDNGGEGPSGTNGQEEEEGEEGGEEEEEDEDEEMEE